MKFVIVVILLNLAFILNYAGEKDVVIRNVASESFDFK